MKKNPFRARIDGKGEATLLLHGKFDLKMGFVVKARPTRKHKWKKYMVVTMQDGVAHLKEQFG